MGFKILAIFCIFIMAASVVFAAQARKIQLNDGSVIIGEVVSFANGVYTIKSKSTGNIKINESNIKSISVQSHNSEVGQKQEVKTGSSNVAVAAGIDALKRAMQNNEAIMGSISSLQEDPEFKEILKDPAIMQAVEANDIQTLMANPKFMKLLNHPSVNQIGSEVE